MLPPLNKVYTPAEYDRTGPRRYITISANISKKDLGTATSDVQKVVKSLGTPPKGLVATIEGMSNLLTDTLTSLQNGLAFAIFGYLPVAGSKLPVVQVITYSFGNYSGE